MKSFIKIIVLLIVIIVLPLIFSMQIEMFIYTKREALYAIQDQGMLSHWQWLQQVFFEHITGAFVSATLILIMIFINVLLRAPQLFPMLFLAAFIDPDGNGKLG